MNSDNTYIWKNEKYVIIIIYRISHRTCSSNFNRSESDDLNESQYPKTEHKEDAKSDFVEEHVDVYAFCIFICPFAFVEQHVVGNSKQKALLISLLSAFTSESGAQMNVDTPSPSRLLL